MSSEVVAARAVGKTAEDAQKCPCNIRTAVNFQFQSISVSAAFGLQTLLSTNLNVVINKEK